MSRGGGRRAERKHQERGKGARRGKWVLLFRAKRNPRGFNRRERETLRTRAERGKLLCTNGLHQPKAKKKVLVVIGKERII